MSQGNNGNSAEELRYGMLGGDSSSETDKLEKYVGKTDWGYLKQHFDSGALLYVDQALDLVDVGKAIANDDKEAVLSWKKAGDLVQPSEPHAAFWAESNAEFTALVVSPFVLIQAIE